MVGRRNFDSVTEKPLEGGGIGASNMHRQKRVDSGSGVIEVGPSASPQYIGFT